MCTCTLTNWKGYDDIQLAEIVEIQGLGIGTMVTTNKITVPSPQPVTPMELKHMQVCN